MLAPNGLERDRYISDWIIGIDRTSSPHYICASSQVYTIDFMQVVHIFAMTSSTI